MIKIALKIETHDERIDVAATQATSNEGWKVSATLSHYVFRGVPVTPLFQYDTADGTNLPSLVDSANEALAAIAKTAKH